jgi:multimeric flavodoxin WrbA
MIESFRARLGKSSRVININEYPIKGGCLGCFGCAVSGECVYNDGFDKFLREEIQTSDSIIYAFKITDHSMGTRFKMYDDRQFCNGHRTVTMGMPFGYLVSGNLSEEENLRMIIEARAQVGGNFLAGVATDETNPDEEIDRLAETLNYAIENKYVPPQNFYGIGGMKIFRDLIWQMQGMMKADHKFYKSHGQYDFPQKKWPRMLAMYAVGAMIGNPKIKAKMGNKMNEGMLMPYKKLLESLDKK